MYLSARNIVFAHNSTFRIDGLDLGVERGEMLGIIGPNGSGKTTLLKLLAGILRPAAGTVVLGDRDLGAMTRRQLARIRAYVAEGAELPFDYTVHEIVALGRYPHAGMFVRLDTRDDAVLGHALELTDTRRLVHRKFFTLSRGEKQRVMLAMAIAQEPQLLLLDEPISHLDIGHQLAFMHTLLQLHANGTTIVSVLHELPLAREFFGRLCLMDSGRIVRCAPSGDRGLMDDITNVFGVADERFL